MTREHLDPFFLDLAEEGAQYGLLCLMTGISEEFWAAGWMSGLEFSLWRAANGGERGYGMGKISDRQATLLKLLSDEAEGWWIYEDSIGPRFLSMKAWLAKLDALKADAQGGQPVRSDMREKD